MARSYTSEHGEKETKGENAGATSASRRSRRKDSEPITPGVRLRIVQQALYDYYSNGGAGGITTFYSQGHSHVVIAVFEGVDLVDGNLVLAEG